MPGGACTQMAIAQAVDWDTPANFAAAEIWPILSETISNEIEQLQNDELGGCVEPGPSNSGTQIVRGTVTRYLHYSGDELALAVGMGETDLIVGTPDQLDLTRVGDLNGLGVTLWLDKVVSTWRVDVAKIESIAITGSAGDGRMMITYTIIGHAYESDDPQDWSTISEPLPNVNNFVLFRHLEYLIGPQAGGALDPVNDVQILQGMSIEITNALAEDFRNKETSEEPDRDGWGLVSGDISIGKYESNDRVDDYANQVPVKQLFTFTGSGDFELIIGSPGAKLTSPSTPQIPGPGRVPHDYTWAGERAASIPAGMLAVDTFFSIFDVPDPFA